MENVKGTSGRWWIFVLIFLGYINLTLNWFNIVSCFGPILVELNLDIPALGMLISLFMLGYGAFYIPTGFIAKSLGLKNTLILGILVESIFGIVSGVTSSYTVLAVSRILTGVGAAMFAGCSVGILTVWFRKGKYLATVMGLTTGVAFAVGQIIGLYPWVTIANGVGWRISLYIAGSFGIVIAILSLFFIKAPKGEEHELKSSKLSMQGVKQTLGSKDIWLYGLAMIGAYGAMIAGSQIISGYAMQYENFTASQAGALAAIIPVAGILGAAVSGIWSDKVGKRKPFIIYPIWLAGISFALIPFVHGIMLWVIAAIIGFTVTLSFTILFALPGSMPSIKNQDIATAFGLLLTIAVIGGFVVPIIFTNIVGAGAFSGYKLGWIILGVISVVFSLLAYFGKEVGSKPIDQQSIDNAS